MAVRAGLVSSTVVVVALGAAGIGAASTAGDPIVAVGLVIGGIAAGFIFLIGDGRFLISIFESIQE